MQFAVASTFFMAFRDLLASAFCGNLGCMIKPLSAVAMLLALASVAKGAPTETNVLQEINLQLTIYQQGTTNSAGTKVSDIATDFTSKSLIADVEAAAGGDFGPTAKLVQSTVYSNATIALGPASYTTVLSTNLPLATNGYLNVGGAQLYNAFNNAGIVVITNNVLPPPVVGTMANDLVSAETSGGVSTASVTINTNAGYITTLTPITNGSGSQYDVTNVLILTQQVSQETTNVLTNISTSIGILYGTDNTLYPITNLVLSANSPQIIVETGGGLDTANGYVASQSAFSISNLVIDFTANGPTNLYVSMQGFVKQALKIDTLYSHGATKVVEDLYDGSSTWSLIGSGFAGGTYSTNNEGTFIQGLPVYLTNGSPVVAQGSLTLSFLKNLAQ